MTLQNHVDTNVNSKMVQSRISTLPVMQTKNFNNSSMFSQIKQNGNVNSRK